MAVLIFLITIGAVGLAGYLVWSFGVWLRMPERQLARYTAKWAQDASKAARLGQYAERDRLDHAANAVLSGLTGGSPEPFRGTRHDDWTGSWNEET